MWWVFGLLRAASEHGRIACLQNKKNTPERLELMKYNKYLRRQTLHREIK